MFKSKDGKIEFKYKSDAVEYVLANDAKIAEWYEEEHEVDADWIGSLNASNCNTYGMNAPGDLCDLIIADGISDGVIIEIDD